MWISHLPTPKLACYGPSVSVSVRGQPFHLHHRLLSAFPSE